MTKTSDARIVEAARQIIIGQGIDQLTQRGLAAAVGIKAPSLYKRFADQAALLRAVRGQALADLEARLRRAAGDQPPAPAALRMANAFRAYALEAPGLYRLIFDAALQDPERTLERAALAPSEAALAPLAGGGQGASSAHAMLALLHGLVRLEIDGAAPVAGPHDEAFRFAIYALLQGIARSAG